MKHYPNIIGVGMRMLSEGLTMGPARPKEIGIDIETFSSVDLTKCGVYKYVEASDFEIMLLAYSIDRGPVEVIDLKGIDLLGPDPDDIERVNDILSYLTDPKILKTAYNANFERTCLAKHFGIEFPPAEWECTMARASMLGLPLSLEAAARILQLQEEKNAEGKALIKYFSMPCKPTKVNGQRTRNLPEHDTEKWQRFVEYCRQDVVVEQEIRKATGFFEIPVTERRMWELDQRINDAGVLLDLTFVNNAIKQDVEYREKLTTEAIRLTGLSNPNSAGQLKDWLSEELDTEVTQLRKTDIPELLKQSKCNNVNRVLAIRGEMAKTSVKKYIAMHKVVCGDGRVRGLLQYYGANRTGRFAGRLVQVQNLPKAADAKDENYLGDLDLPRNLVRAGDLDMVELLFGNVPDVLSQLIRTAFIAPEGHRFIPSDFSAIEARVIAWLAGERWRLDVFNTHGKIYEASAAQMFKVPLESVTKGSTLRQKGKMAELALGYQGGPNAIINIEVSNKTPTKDRIPEEELPKLVKMWRNANKKIVQLWYDVEEAAIDAVETGELRFIAVRTNGKSKIYFKVEHNILFITLPSGRRLAYQSPTLVPNQFNGQSLRYWGMDQTTKQWKRVETYGGKLVENIVQAIARDCLVEAMLRLDVFGYKIAFHVHDEAVLEVPNGSGSVDEVNRIMSQPISWAEGLPLKAESYETNYYKKD